MAEYIERSYIRKMAMFEMAYTMETETDAAVVLRMIDDAPAADVAPVVHGRWIGAPLCGNDNCRCSACGSWHNIHANLRGEIMQKYCPDCGAKMDIEDGGDGDAVD